MVFVGKTVTQVSSFMLVNVFVCLSPNIGWSLAKKLVNEKASNYKKCIPLLYECLHQLELRWN